MKDSDQSRYTYDSEPWDRPDDGVSRYSYDARAGEVRVKGPSPKLVIGIVIVVVLAVAAVAVTFVLWLNSKQPATAEEFTAVMAGHGLQVQELEPDWTEEAEYYRTVLESTDGETCQIVYYHMTDSQTARRLFTNARTMLEYEKRSFSSTVSVNMGRFGSYSQTSDGLYSCVSYIGDTVISVRAEEYRKDEMREILKELGY